MYAPTPDAEINILRNIPLDANYEHTIYFASAGAQYSYFSSHASSSFSFTDGMYNRKTGRIRFPNSGDQFASCNYLMYRNRQYLDKWFYAFIDEIYYINDNCCEIAFTIDVMQTYFFDCTIPDCWIERQHTPTDVIGENLVEENINIGEYEVESTEAISDLANDWSVIMFSTFDPATYQPAGGDLNSGMYSALARSVIGRVTLTQTQSGVTGATWMTDPRPKIQDIIQNHADLVDGVVAIVMAPTYFETQHIKDVAISRPSTYSDYTVKNKKLFTSPYLVIYASDGTNNGKFYQFEEFKASNGLTAQFSLISDNAPAQTVVMAPSNYKYDARGTSASTLNYSEMMMMTGFPQCAWLSDAFKTYLAQNSTNTALSAGINALKIGGGIATMIATGGAGTALGAGMVVSGIQGIAGQVADLADKSKRAPENHGSVTGTALFIAGEKAFRYYVMRPRADYLKICDDYFDKFGYAIKAIGTPNFTARPHWTYIKTSGVVVKSVAGYAGNAQDRKKIAEILDRGITFWRNGSEVGDYSLNNTV